ncbi:metal-dependent hydrolase [Haloarcula litorea]|uniref:metal-dependent hydrolase n=1 Tax=Haloarcula litorea TaxID=3032579 RepID=UPI0023E7F6D0|nr:metal-dependent hydrolase [Halomicroarcula sp. GDY20]
MVDVAGHIGMALLWLAPTWRYIDDPRTTVAVVAAAAPFGMLPDVDLYLRRVFPTVQHHGVFHTVLAVTVAAVLVGPLLGRALARGLDDRWLSPPVAARSARVGSVVVWVAGLAHVFADMLSAPDIAQAVEPFWPVYRQSLGFDVVWYNNPWANWGLLAAGVGIHAVLYWRATGE